MTDLERFLAYFQDFEKTYLDDDWGRLEPYFAPDAVYRVEGAGSIDCELRGRDALLSGIRKFLDGFDRRCEREIVPNGAPVVDGPFVRVRGTVLYTRGDSEQVRLEIEEEAEYRDGVIAVLTDRYAPGTWAAFEAWAEHFAADLDPSYT